MVLHSFSSFLNSVGGLELFSLFALLFHYIGKLLKSPSNTFEPNAYIGDAPTVKHEQRHEHDRQEVLRKIENQRILHGRIRLARRQHRLLHEQTKVKPMWDDDIDWDDDTPAVREPDWQDEVEWE